MLETIGNYTAFIIDAFRTCLKLNVTSASDNCMKCQNHQTKPQIGKKTIFYKTISIYYFIFDNLDISQCNYVAIEGGCGCVD